MAAFVQRHRDENGEREQENAEGEHHPKWSEIVEGKFKQWGGEKAVSKVLVHSKQAAVYSWNQALPVLKAWYHKLKG
jgi:hypothetical protein